MAHEMSKAEMERAEQRFEAENLVRRAFMDSPEGKRAVRDAMKELSKVRKNLLGKKPNKNPRSRRVRGA